MSAYGALVSATSALRAQRATHWLVPLSDSLGPDLVPRTLTIYHLTLSRARNHQGIVEYLHEIFAAEIERGATYPQETLPGEPYTLSAFETYFFAGDVFVAFANTNSQPGQDAVRGLEIGVAREVDVDLDQTRSGRPWSECIAGFYYIKPNYPGRSSHICNGGFVVPPSQRGNKYANVLASSYVHYAPKLGYQASVFNLVYANNIGSIRLWDKLGFTRAGRIPRAGRLKRLDGEGEEYVDAWVYYKSFVGDEEP